MWSASAALVERGVCVCAYGRYIGTVGRSIWREGLEAPRRLADSYAEKMEETGEPGKAQISTATYEYVRDVNRYKFEAHSLCMSLTAKAPTREQTWH